MAHRIALYGLNFGLVRRQNRKAWPRLKTSIAGLTLANPLGLAAGFDKNAEAVSGLARVGFGWLEVGTITPFEQAGNPQPRLFRLTENQALINRMGFNNEGLEAAKRRLARRNHSWGIVGANIGANKGSDDPIKDYVTCLAGLYDLVDYFTINVSSPNTPGLRDLQGRGHLTKLLTRLCACRANLEQNIGKKPLFLKIAPDLNSDDENDVADVAVNLDIDGIIISNTTLDRPEDLVGPNRNEKGGLSGRPLFNRSIEQIRHFYQLTNGKLPLIGVGGIASGIDAYEKIRAGASALQVYTSFIYGGHKLIPKILGELDQQLVKDGFANLSEAVGSNLQPVASNFVEPAPNSASPVRMCG